jgi:hypothetical protein
MEGDPGQNQSLTYCRLSTSGYLKRSSTRSRTNNKISSLRVVDVVAQGVTLVDGVTEDEVLAEEVEGVVEEGEDNKPGSCVTQSKRLLPKVVRRKLWDICGCQQDGCGRCLLPILRYTYSARLSSISSRTSYSNIGQASGHRKPYLTLRSNGT